MKKSARSILFLALPILCALLLSLSVSASTTDDYTYEQAADGVRITAYSGNSNAVVIPATLDGQPVISVGNGVFSSHTEIVRLDILAPLTSIGDSAFSGCSSLLSVRLPDTLVCVGNSAFSGCSSLINVYLGSSVASIGDSAFSGCSSLPGITLPGALGSVGESTFSGCTSLSTVIVCPTHISFGNNCFSGIPSLTVCAPASSNALSDAAIPENAVKITAAGADALIFDSALGGYAVIGCRTAEKAIIVPATYNGRPVTEIADGAFSASNRQPTDTLCAVSLPASIKKLGNSAFAGDTYLKYISLPPSLESTAIPEKCFLNCVSLGSAVIPDCVDSIRSSAFSGCISLKVVYFPSTLEGFSAAAFYGCSSLERAIFTGNEPECAGRGVAATALCFGNVNPAMKISVYSPRAWAGVDKNLWYPNGRGSNSGFAISTTLYDCFFVEHINVRTSCTHDGDSNYICPYCGKIYNVVTPTLPHEYVSVGISEDGVETFRCKNCTANYTKIRLDRLTINTHTDASRVGEELLTRLEILFRGTPLVRGVDYEYGLEYIPDEKRLEIGIRGIGDCIGELTVALSSVNGARIEAHTLNVIGGTGGGVYYPGTLVTLTCEQKPGYETTLTLYKIQDYRFENGIMTFVMPDSDASVRFSYKKDESDTTPPPDTTTSPPDTTEPPTSPPDTTTAEPEETTTAEPYSHTREGREGLGRIAIWGAILIVSLAAVGVVILLSFKER